MSMPNESSAEDRILTVPNVITLVRLACLPLFVWLLLAADNALLAGALRQVSTFGKVFDPVVDRLLFFVSIVAIIIAGAAPLWFCIAVLLREVVISLATVVLATLGARRIDVTWMGKTATFGLMFAFPAFLWASSSWPLQSTFEVLAWVCAIPALTASYYAAALYIPLGLGALREGRALRTPKP